MTDQGHKICDGCGEPISLDDDLYRPAGALLHARPACAQAWLDKQRKQPEKGV